VTFTLTKTTFGGFSTLTVKGAGARAEIAEFGATLLSWSVGGVELIDGYATPSELQDQAGVRSGIMVPFSNRIPAGRYRFDGRDFDYETGGEAVMHGMLREVEFEVIGVETDEGSASVHFTTSELRPGRYAGYPFAVDVAVDVTITARGVEFAITGTNVGDEAAPFGSGWHPYFRIGANPIEQLDLVIPARTRIVPGLGLIPLEGTEAFVPVEGEWDFTHARPIGDQVIDMAFFDLETGDDGLVHTTLSDGTTILDVWQERGGMHVFTADTVPRPRKSFAMEPIEFVTNAANRPDQAQAIRLEPGASRTFRFGAAASSTLEHQ